MYEDYGRDAAINDGGRFTEQGYIYNNKNTFTEWYNGKESDISLGLSMNFEAVTARYVDVRLERKKEVLDAYHGAVKQADPAKAEKAEPKKAKSAAKKKSSDLEL